MTEVYRPGFGGTGGHVSLHIPGQPGLFSHSDWRPETDYRTISEFPEAQTRSVSHWAPEQAGLLTD